MFDGVDIAAGYLGTPYQFGGSCPEGMDCSGLVQQAYPKLPRTAREMFKATQRIVPGQLQRGDLVFLHNTQKGLPAGSASHVGIYDGAGNMIAASSVHGRVERQPLQQWLSNKNLLGFGRVNGAMSKSKQNRVALGNPLLAGMAPPETSPIRGSAPPAAAPIPNSGGLFGGAAPQFGLAPGSGALNGFTPSFLSGLVPDPPDLSVQRAELARLLMEEARLAPNPLTLQAAQAHAHLAGDQARLGALPVPDPSDPRFAYSPYQAPAMPQRQIAEIPTRPAPGSDPMAGILAAIAGVFSPQSAGALGAAPLAAAQRVAGQQYSDSLQHYGLQKEVNDTAFSDALAGRADQVRTDLMNREGALGAAERFGSAQDKLGYLRADLLDNTGEAQSLAPALDALAGRQNQAEQFHAQALGAQRDIAAQQEAYKQSLAYQQHMFGPEARLAAAQIQALASQANTGARLTEQQQYHQSLLDIAQQNADTRAAVAALQQQMVQPRIDDINSRIAYRNGKLSVDERKLEMGPSGKAKENPEVKRAWQDYQMRARSMNGLENQLVGEFYRLNQYRTWPSKQEEGAALSQFIHQNVEWQARARDTDNALAGYRTVNSAASIPTPNAPTSTPRPDAGKGTGSGSGAAQAGKTVLKFDSATGTFR